MKTAAYSLCPYLNPKKNTVIQKIVFFTTPQAPPKTHTHDMHIYTLTFLRRVFKAQFQWRWVLTWESIAL